MAQSTILALGHLAASSSDVVVAAGALPAGLQLSVMSDTPGADVLAGLITEQERIVSVNGPGTFRVLRPLIDATIPVGVFLESA